MSPAGGALLGLAVGGAVLLVGHWLSDRRPKRLLDRLAPYVAEPRAGRRAAVDPTIDLRWVLSVLDRRGPSSEERAGIGVLLRRAGLPDDLDRHRLDRLAWVAGGALAGLVAGLVLLGQGPMGILAATTVSGAAAGWWGSDQRLRHRARSRQQAIERQLPMLADLLALALSAGATPMAALEAAAASTSGPVAVEVRRAAGEVRSGEPVPIALRRMADDVGLAPLQRLVDAVLVALDHGTPVADVARAQACDLRSDERRRLMEAAGRKDIAMLVPIVFLVLPSVVLIALYPGLQSLRLVVP